MKLTGISDHLMLNTQQYSELNTPQMFDIPPNQERRLSSIHTKNSMAKSLRNACSN